MFLSLIIADHDQKVIEVETYDLYIRKKSVRTFACFYLVVNKEDARLVCGTRDMIIFLALMK